MRGPFQKDQTDYKNGPESAARQTMSRVWYTQDKPYVHPLPYTFYRCSVSDHPLWELDAQFFQGLSSDSEATSTYAEAYAKAYEGLKNQISGTASLAVNLAERKQSVDMIAKRASQLLRFGRQLKSFDFLGAAKTLGLKPRKEESGWRRLGKDRVYRLKTRKRELNLRPSAKSFGSNWLEFHFGWAPLVKDIHSSATILNEPLFRNSLYKSIEGRATVWPQQPPAPSLNQDGQFGYTDHTMSHVKIGCRIAVSDPNAFNLNRLGLINPALVVWELVPFSFVLDWFTNVSSVLSSYTDFVGLSVTDSYTTHFAMCKRRVWNYYDPALMVYRPDWPASWAGLNRTASAVSVFCQRKSGIATPSLVFKELKAPSAIRGLTAISLLTGFLGGKK